ncbi:hypothetical protein [Micromonospora sp. NPDC002717]|uniref:hypothetical protein n=1 Tax=Micromonospora sp. NPDC002717 TaxID=3154424 RepID=UPI00332B4C7B
MLLTRKLVAADNPRDAILASRRGTWLSPNNVRRQWRQAGADIDLDWVTHTFRKTVATLIKERRTPKAPQDPQPPSGTVDNSILESSGLAGGG